MASLKRARFLAQGAAFTLFASSTAPALADATAIEVGTLPSDANAVVNYADDLGYFKDAGIDARIMLMNNSNATASAVLGGSLDIGAGNVGSLAVARSRGIPLRLIAPAQIATNLSAGGALMVPKDSTIKTAADLNNKVVAIVGIKTQQEAAFLTWLDKNGGDSKSVKFIEIPFPSMGGALEARRVDAALINEPFISRARAQSRIVSDDYYKALRLPVLMTCFFATENWLQRNADTAKKFAGAIHRAALWANGHPKESADLLARFTKLDPNLVRAMIRPVYGTSLDVAMIAPVINAMLNYGFLGKAVNPSELIWQPDAAGPR